MFLCAIVFMHLERHVSAVDIKYTLLLFSNIVNPILKNPTMSGGY
eukprot:UN11450